MSPDSKANKVLYTKSYPSLYDIFGDVSYTNLIHNMGITKPGANSVFQAAAGESAQHSLGNVYLMSKSTNYVTSEQYNAFTEESPRKKMAPSTSTIFYDLDDVAKRHSFHCLTQLNMSNTNLMKMTRLPPSPTALGENVEPIDEECATQKNKLPRDSIELTPKKVKKKFSQPSSEMYTRDAEDLHNLKKKYDSNSMSDKHQKIYSFAKYRTEYTKPTQEKRSRKNDKAKRAMDPCPCQLFSYACPCTFIQKSTSDLANISNSLSNFVDQITSTSKIVEDDEVNKSKKAKREHVREDKPTNTSIVQLAEVIVPNEKKASLINTANKNEISTSSDKSNDDKQMKNKTKPRKMSRKVLCPNCKEKVDVVISISTTEEETSLKYEHSLIYRTNEIPSTTAYACRASPNGPKNIHNSDLCEHEPPCELVPVCQILPTDNFYNNNHKCAKKYSGPKSTPRVIRITKACRHHPPCTVVPSCQRANVLKNNCEYIPPCMHRPRCVNLPLCAPYSKSLHYEEATNKVVDNIDVADCLHAPKCKYIPVCEHESITNTMNHQINIVSRVPNACEFLNDYNPPAFLMNAKSPCVTNTFSPCQINPNLCFATDHYTCISNKSCQFESAPSKSPNETKENLSNETIIFIRDVGCQFRNKSYSPKDSALHSKGSSKSFDFHDVKMGNYYTNIHTLRYEDKSTSPLSGEDYSFTTISSSLYLDSECPSHGRHHCQRTTGFIPKSAYVTAFSSVPESQSSKYEVNNKLNTYPVKSRRSFLKDKYKKMFSVKRRRKSRMATNVNQIPVIVQNG